MKQKLTTKHQQRLTREFLAQREQLGQMTPDLLLIFADGQVDVLAQVAAGLRTVAPGHPDLPMIHAVIHDMQGSTKNVRHAGGPGKGKRPVYSIPMQDVPQSFLAVIQTSDHGPRLKRNLIFTLRQILGAARRENLPAELNRISMTAYRAELDVRSLSAKTVELYILDLQHLGLLFKLDAETQEIIANEYRVAKSRAAHEPSKLHAAFRANPVSPLDYARKARNVSKEAFATQGNRQTVQRLFMTAATLSLLSFIPERVSDILGAVVGRDVTRDARGWSSEYFARKSGVDRSFEYLPDQMTPYLDDLILLGAEAGPRGSDLLRLYRYRVSLESPLFARIDLRRAYSPRTIWGWMQEQSGHGPHAARKAMTDYLAEIGGTPEDVLSLLGHRQIATSEKHYAVRAAAIHRQRTLGKIDDLREALTDQGTFRLPTGRLVDLDRITKDMDRQS